MLLGFFLDFFRMGSKLILCLLLYVAIGTDGGVFGKDGESEAYRYRWTKQNLPLLLDTHTQLLNTPSFRGQVEDEEKGETKSVCGIECQSRLLPMGQAEQEKILGYETMYENGTRTHTDISFRGFNKTPTGFSVNTPPITRWKRQVYGSDGRFVISDAQFITKYPFSAAVRLSTNCTGVLISPMHVLTAAHCIHDGREYLETLKKLKVGYLQLKNKRGQGRRRGRGGRRQGGRKREGETGGEKEEEQTLEDGKEINTLDRGLTRRREGGDARRRRQRRKKGRATAQLDRGEKGKQRGVSRVQRSTEHSKQPVFRWTQVKQTRIPQGWILADQTNYSVSSDYDYALLELKRPIKQRYMKLGVAPATAPLARIHFSGFDADKGLQDGGGDEKVIYRFCSVAKESDDLMYQHCDAQSGATGAGVYIRLRQETGDTDGKGKWQRRVIGVFSGHQWVEMEGGELTDFNVAVRITPPKYAQICHWVHGDLNQCKEV